MKIGTESKVEGTYDIRVQTPMGVEQGVLKVVVDGESISGTIINTKGTTEFTDGVLNNNELQFQTKIKTPMGRLKAKVTLKVEQDTLTGVAKLPLGAAKIEGKRVH